MADNENRLMIVHVGYNAILWLLRGPSPDGRVDIVSGFEGLPKDLEIVSVHHEHGCRSFAVTIRHPSFEVVPDGCFIRSFHAELRFNLYRIVKPGDMPPTSEAYVIPASERFVPQDWVWKETNPPMTNEEIKTSLNHAAKQIEDSHIGCVPQEMMDDFVRDFAERMKGQTPPDFPPSPFDPWASPTTLYGLPVTVDP
ncbi:MAG: hypothetical protein Q7R41_18630, partial [Phycisphaerales bacterium]|nr:hypothetical protein [Phycisphaerales bacterium]